MLHTLLIILLVLAIFGGFPAAWGYRANWGYYPVGGVGLVVTILIILLLLGKI